MRIQLATFAVLLLVSQSAIAQFQDTTIGASYQVSFYICDGCNPSPVSFVSYGVPWFTVGSYIRGFVDFGFAHVTESIISARLELRSFSLGAANGPINFYVAPSNPFSFARQPTLPAENLIGSWGLYEHQTIDRSFSFDVSESVRRSQGYIAFVLVEPVGSNSFYDSKLRLTLVPEPSSEVLCLAGIFATQLRRKRRR